MMAGPDSNLHPQMVSMLATFAGALVTLSLAPFDIWPAGILSCLLWAALLHNCSPRQALWRGWLFGLGMYGSGVSWTHELYWRIGQHNVRRSNSRSMMPCKCPWRLSVVGRWEWSWR